MPVLKLASARFGIKVAKPFMTDPKIFNFASRQSETFKRFLSRDLSISNDSVLESPQRRMSICTTGGRLTEKSTLKKPKEVAVSNYSGKIGILKRSQRDSYYRKKFDSLGDG